MQRHGRDRTVEQMDRIQQLHLVARESLPYLYSLLGIGSIRLLKSVTVQSSVISSRENRLVILSDHQHILR